MEKEARSLKLVLFDFGGVIAEEGFKAAMVALAKRDGLDVNAVKKTAFDLVYDTGFTTGKIRDTAFWPKFREATGIQDADGELTAFVLQHFVVRDNMVSFARRIRAAGIRTAILSDQTHWLEELEAKNGFSSAFEAVFNSYDLGITKKDPVIFRQVLATLKVAPHEALFIDDHAPHIERARAEGLDVIRYEDAKGFGQMMHDRLPDIPFETA